MRLSYRDRSRTLLIWPASAILNFVGTAVHRDNFGALGPNFCPPPTHTKFGADIRYFKTEHTYTVMLVNSSTVYV